MTMIPRFVWERVPVLKSVWGADESKDDGDGDGVSE